MNVKKVSIDETPAPTFRSLPEPPPYSQNEGQSYQPYVIQTPGTTSSVAALYSPQQDVEGQPDDKSVNEFDFNDKTIRRAFIRKVYSILMVQLSISFGFISLFVLHEPTVEWVHENPFVYLIALFVMFTSLIVIVCCKDARRKSPLNYILLAVFTLSTSFWLGVASARYEVVAVLLAVGITAVLCLALTLFAFQTKWDFTVLGGGLYVALIVLLMFGFFVFVVPMPVLSLVYASIGALLFSIYLIYDTQIMMGGDHKFAVSPEEYVVAALNLYLDIVNLFLFILRLMR